MPPENFWRSLPEIEILSRIAAYEDIPFRIVGSVAERLVEAAKRSTSAKSLYDFVRPFSDIDLLATSPDGVARLRSLIFEVVPGAGFFHWEIRTQEDLARYQSLASVKLLGQPEILLQRKQKSRELDSKDTAVILEFCRSSQELSARELGVRSVSVKQIRAQEVAPEHLLTDLLYMARRFPNLLREGEKGAKLVARVRSLDERRLVSRLPRSIQLPLLKFLFAESERRRAGQGEFDLRVTLGGKLSDALEASPVPLTARLFSLCCRGGETSTLIATIVPRCSKGGRWKRKVDAINFVSEGSEARRPKLLLVDEPETEKLDYPGLDSPVITVVTDEPPRPGCCAYRDFARGIAEMGWIEPPGTTPGPLGTWSFVFGRDGKDPAIIQSRPSFGDATASFRIDYNLLCILNGTAGPVHVAAAPRKWNE